MFSNDKKVHEVFQSETSSGSMVINDAVVHLSVETLPFGGDPELCIRIILLLLTVFSGVGESGMGSYHGRYTFLTFSHEKSVLVRDFSKFGEYLGETRYPPYEEWKIKRLGFLVKNRKMPSFLSVLPYVTCFFLGIGSVFMYNYITSTFNL